MKPTTGIKTIEGHPRYVPVVKLTGEECIFVLSYLPHGCSLYNNLLATLNEARDKAQQANEEMDREDGRLRAGQSIAEYNRQAKL